ncbi:MAG: GNAT family N-acetyltransferase [Thaumarchaeota archaeon]|nr:GNAT family N-acetyltransferase [Nitrososphaerota archaeon]
MRVEIKQERADTPEAMRMLDELDRYLISLYPPESNHLLSISELLEPNVSFFVARMNGTAVGCGALLIKSGYGEIKRMFVKPEKRGLGVGDAIISKLCDVARCKGLKTARLETGTLQDHAIRLYERAGFRRIGPFGDYQADPLSILYELSL